MLVFILMLLNGNHMPNLDSANKLRDYLADVLHQPISLTPLDTNSELPAYLSQRYRVFDANIAGHRCLFAVQDTHEQGDTPGDIAKHIDRLQAIFDQFVVYAADQLSSDRRARFISNGVAFAIPGNQLYIPQLAMDLREHFRARPKLYEDQLSPVAQAVLFHHILRVDGSGATPTALADTLQYSAMSVGRAFDELTIHNLADVKKQGRRKIIEFNEAPRLLIELARPLLRKPARTVLYVDPALPLPNMLLAGESALAALTALTPPTSTTYAVHHKRWDVGADSNRVSTVEPDDDSTTVVQLWHYDPLLFSDADTVDPLSLYAEFWDHPNERISKAAASLLEHIA